MATNKREEGTGNGKGNENENENEDENEKQIHNLHHASLLDGISSALDGIIICHQAGASRGV